MPSLRLRQVLKIYCVPDRPDGVKDLTKSLRDGRYPWLGHDLSAALRLAPSSTWWVDTIPTADVIDGAAGSPRRNVRAEQRRLWTRLFPREPFPRDARR